MERKIPPLASKILEPLLVPIGSIKPHPENYKEHPEDQLDSLNASLLAFGWTKPICANPEGFIVAGHGMYLEALRKGYTHVPVEPVPFDKNQSRAYIVADNETARRAKTNQDKLIPLLANISEIPDFDISATGFSKEEVELFTNIDTNFSFDDDTDINPGNSPENTGDDPEDMAEVEGERCGMSYAIHISFSEQERAEAFLNRIGANTKEFVPGKLSTVVNGDELEF